MKKMFSVLLVAFIMITALIPFNMISKADSSTQVYYNIDMSASVLASRINQQVSGDCAIVSMATIEAYMYGVVASTSKTAVYNALVSKNTDNDYAYWSNCGYISADINWTTVYNQLAKGYPCIVHRPASGSKSEHWAVVAGYNGSTTTLEKDKFIIVDVYHGSGGTDIYTSKSWRGSVSINRMAYRKNGIAVTSLSGIRFAINHPSVIHKYGEGHGVYGYIASSSNLTEITFTVTNANSGAAVYNKTVKPNSKSYLIYNLDSEFTFAKWPVGEYFFSVVAKNSSQTNVYCKYFRISSTWPTSTPTKSYSFTFNDGVSETVKANFEGTFKITSSVPQKDGYTFAGWNVQRVGDGKWYCTNGTWSTLNDIQINDYTRKLYSADEYYAVKYEWIKGCMNNSAYNFYAVWEATQSETPTVPETSVVTNVGDVDGNGYIDYLDYLLVKMFYNGTILPDDLQQSRADINGDCNINMMDYILLKRAYFNTYEITNGAKVYNGEDVVADNSATVTDGQLKVSVSVPSEIYAGAYEVNATIVVENLGAQQNLNSVSFVIEYNNDIFELVNTLEGTSQLEILKEKTNWEDLSKVITTENGTQAIYASAVTDNSECALATGDTVVFELPLTVKSSAPSFEGTVIDINDSYVCGTYVADGTGDIVKYNGTGSEGVSCVYWDICRLPDDSDDTDDTTDFLLGDVNMNGNIDMMDYVLLKRAYFGTFKLTAEQELRADINKNGAIDMMDYILLKRAYFGTYEINGDNSDNDNIGLEKATFLSDAKAMYHASSENGYSLWGYGDYTYCVNADGYITFSCPKEEGYYAYGSPAFDELVLLASSSKARKTIRSCKDGKIIAEEGVGEFENASFLIKDLAFGKDYLALEAGYIIAYKYEESFDGVTCYLGFMNAKGEWISEFSADNPILKATGGELPDLYYIDDEILLLDIGNGDELYFYNIETNTLNQIAPHTYDDDILTDDCTGWEFVDGYTQPVNYYLASSKYYAYAKDGSYMTFTLSGVKGEVYLDVKTKTATYIDATNDGYQILDSNGKLIASRSGVTLSSTSGFNREGIAEMYFENALGTRYYTLMNLKGEFLFEPVNISDYEEVFSTIINGKEEDNYNYSFDYAAIDEKGNIVKEAKTKTFGVNNGVICFGDDSGSYEFIK